MRTKIQFKNIQDLPVKITDFIGSSTSIILHTIFFIGIFTLRAFGFSLDSILLILTTLVSLEAIYLAIFIQMTVNRNTQSLQEVEEDIDEIQEDVESLEKDVDEIQEGIEEIQEVDQIEDTYDEKTRKLMESIETRLQSLINDIETLKKQQ